MRSRHSADFVAGRGGDDVGLDRASGPRRFDPNQVIPCQEEIGQFRRQRLEGRHLRRVGVDGRPSDVEQVADVDHGRDLLVGRSQFCQCGVVTPSVDLT